MPNLILWCRIVSTMRACLLEAKWKSFSSLTRCVTIIKIFTFWDWHYSTSHASMYRKKLVLITAVTFMNLEQGTFSLIVVVTRSSFKKTSSTRPRVNSWPHKVLLWDWLSLSGTSPSCSNWSPTSAKIFTWPLKNTPRGQISICGLPLIYPGSNGSILLVVSIAWRA
jgi:hypothetical protein